MLYNGAMEVILDYVLDRISPVFGHLAVSSDLSVCLHLVPLLVWLQLGLVAPLLWCLRLDLLPACCPGEAC